MQILGELRASVSNRFISPTGVKLEVMASSVLPPSNDGQSTWEYPVGTFRMRVGYYPSPAAQVARYTAWLKVTGQPWTPDECKSVLSLLGVASAWTQDKNDFHFREPRLNGTVDLIEAYYAPTRAYLFAYLPGLAFSKADIDARMPLGVTTGPDMSNIFPKKS